MAASSSAGLGEIAGQSRHWSPSQKTELKRLRPQKVAGWDRRLVDNMTLSSYMYKLHCQKFGYADKPAVNTCCNSSGV